MSAASRTVAAVLACGIALVTGVVVGRRTAPAASAEAAKAGAEKDEKPGEKDGDRREVVLSEAGLAAARLQVAKAAKRPLVRELALTGQVEFNPDRVASVGAKIPARIAKVHVAIGDAVTVGQPLAVIDSTELAKARGAYVAAVAKRVAAQAAFARAESLNADGVVPTRQVEETKSELAIATAEVAAARGTLVALGLTDADASGGSVVTLRAPLAGRIVRRDAVMGQSVDGSANLFTIADLSEVWVQLEVFERDIARVPVGTAVNITTNTQPDHAVAGKVTFVTEVLDDKTRTVKARVVLPNTDAALKPGMFVRAALLGGKTQEEPGKGEDALVIPVSAVQRIGDDDYVFIRVEPRKFQARAVALGERAGGFVEVRRGLREGDEVVTEGALTLKAELERASFGDDD